MSAASLYPCTRKRWHGPSPTKPPTRRCASGPSSSPTASGASRPADRLDRAVREGQADSFDDHHVDIKWFADGTLNVFRTTASTVTSPNAATRWRSSGKATIPPTTRNHHRQLHERVCKFANALRGDVHRGDVVTIYMPMIPEAVVAMLACTRIGAIHSVVFGGFSPRPWPDASSIASRRW